MKQSKSALCVLLAGTLWGSMGLFVRKLNAVGLYALDIVQLRIAISLVLVGLYLLIFARDKLRVRLRDLWCFAGTGIVSLLLFSWCYFSGMQEASLSVMAVLLYTSPAFIMLLSVLLFREKLTRQKLLALVLTFTGLAPAFSTRSIRFSAATPSSAATARGPSRSTPSCSVCLPAPRLRTGV